MNITTIHVRGFDSRAPVCGAAGVMQCEDDWKKADSDPRFRRCKRCDKKLGPGGIEQLRKAREDIARLRTAEAAGRNDAEAKRPSQASAYPVGSLEVQSYRRGYDAGQLPATPPKETGIRTVTPGYGEFVATLEAARARARHYNNAERNSITRAITRANRSLANRPED
ncbi:MAG: hypothetical protein OXG72_19280 [Acidobacteria bacterium]|nr:hypothetical protein [Acidobacteriota bacterium]